MFSVIYQNRAMVRTLPVLSIANCVVSNYTFTAKSYVTVTKVSLVLLYLIVSERCSYTVTILRYHYLCCVLSYQNGAVIL